MHVGLQKTNKDIINYQSFTSDEFSKVTHSDVNHPISDSVILGNLNSACEIGHKYDSKNFCEIKIIFSNFKIEESLFCAMFPEIYRIVATATISSLLFYWISDFIAKSMITLLIIMEIMEIINSRLFIRIWNKMFL